MPKSKHSTSEADKNREKVVHPYSRKALKLGKQIVHEKRVETAKSNQALKLVQLAEKLNWFQDHLDDREIYTKQEVVDLVTQYRNRFREELEQINIIHSVGKRKNQSKQHFARESSIKMIEDEESNQFESTGIEVPDLICRKHLQEFRNWNRDVRFIPNLKLKKISIRDLDKVAERSDGAAMVQNNSDTCENSEYISE